MIFFSTQNGGNHKKHLAFIACVVFAKFMMTFAKVKKDLKNKMKKKHLLAGKKRKESRFVSVSHFRYLHYYRVNISTTTTREVSFCNMYSYTSRGKSYKIVETGREQQQ